MPTQEQVMVDGFQAGTYHDYEVLKPNLVMYATCEGKAVVFFNLGVDRDYEGDPGEVKMVSNIVASAYCVPLTDEKGIFDYTPELQRFLIDFARGCEANLLRLTASFVVPQDVFDVHNTRFLDSLL